MSIDIPNCFENNISNKHGKKPPSETSFADLTTFKLLSVNIKSLIFFLVLN